MLKPRLMRWIPLLLEFDVVNPRQNRSRRKSGPPDHLSRLEKPHQDKLEYMEITENFPLDSLGTSVALRVDCCSMVCRFRKLHAGEFHCQGMSSTEKTSFSKIVKPLLLGCTPSCFKICADQIIPGGVAPVICPRVVFKNWGLRAIDKGKILHQRDVMPQIHIQSLVKSLTFGASTSWDLFLSIKGNKYYTCWLFGAPRAIISDRGTHFCNDQFAKVEVSNRGLKRILDKEMGRKSMPLGRDKQDDALWLPYSVQNQPSGHPYSLYMDKACHLRLSGAQQLTGALKIMTTLNFKKSTV
ncbi:reverse transcriptase domain-containing protein [Tanacetum coccineum]|uniref:Reverse transcriptase domain-containing protein n=1 Tax=Tanacetum coccineum TaxID=301880 RepID=A0ABQ4ZJP6_9ASTR